MIRVLLALVGLCAAAAAQPAPGGVIRGVVVDDQGGALAGVTVIATAPGTAPASALSDEHGAYAITALAPGDYTVTFYYLDDVDHRTVHVGTDATELDERLRVTGHGETIEVRAPPPKVDTTSTSQGITIDSKYLENVPMRGRTFEAALGAAAGAQGDALGYGFGGSTSLENQYYIDGMNTTDVTFGIVGAPIINDFVDHIDVLTAGYGAELGRATGGRVDVITKSGTNTLSGSIFATGRLTAASQPTPVNGSSIDVTPDGTAYGDLGFDLGGPIIKNKLWFFVGFAPQITHQNYLRTTKRLTDCRVALSSGKLSACEPLLTTYGGFADAKPDIDPKTDLFVTEPVASEDRTALIHRYQAIAKLDYAASPEHQGQLAIEAQPTTTKQPELSGVATSGYRSSSMVTNTYAKWRSKLDDNHTEIEASLGWYRNTYNQDAIESVLENVAHQSFYDTSLDRLGPVFGESAAGNAGCFDGPPGGADRYPFITNCPMTAVRPYETGGPGQLFRNRDERRTARLAVIERAEAAGNHEIEAGVDVEDNLSVKSRLFSGGGFLMTDELPGSVLVSVTRWVELGARDSSDPRYNTFCYTPNPKAPSLSVFSDDRPLTFRCELLGGVPGTPGTQIHENTLNWSTFLRDSWRLRSDLTVNAGVRYEEQRLRYASFLQGTIDPTTHVRDGKNALVLDGLIAPRVGVVYDPTHVGRAKLFAHWGRFYESIPMSIDDAAFGGAVLYVQKFSPGDCTAPFPPIGADGTPCLTPRPVFNPNGQLLGAGGVLVAPGTKAQYIDELVTGGEIEIANDLRVGAVLEDRRVGRVLDDLSTDGANTFVIGNPGEWSASDEQRFVAQIAQVTDPIAKEHMTEQLAAFRGIRLYDRPTRVYDALQLTLTRRFSDKLYLQSSYVYSRTLGNYPGALSPQVGDYYANTTSQYQLIELRANRAGPLPQDRPHTLKLNGFYAFHLAHAVATLGASFHLVSGAPENVLASNATLGPNQSYLLPRGTIGRTELDHGLDLRASYRRMLSKRRSIEVFGDVFNVYDHEAVATVDEVYALPTRPSLPSSQIPLGYQNANPVSGGSYQDLLWVRTINAVGQETPWPITRNPDYGRPLSRTTPRYLEIGMRITF